VQHLRRDADQVERASRRHVSGQPGTVASRPALVG
jgi:hypothetical protein